jgi:hypothetical protein
LHLLNDLRGLNVKKISNQKKNGNRLILFFKTEKAETAMNAACETGLLCPLPFVERSGSVFFLQVS